MGWCGGSTLALLDPSFIAVCLINGGVLAWDSGARAETNECVGVKAYARFGALGEYST